MSFFLNNSNQNNSSNNINKFIIYQGRQWTHIASLQSSGKAISIIYSECLSVALGIQPEMRMRFICGPSSSTIFLHIIS
jgi:hypothetical protein